MNIFNFFKKKRDEDIFERFRTAVFDLQAEIDHAFNGDMFSLDLLQRGIAQIQAVSVAMREIKFAPEINIYMEGLLTLIQCQKLDIEVMAQGKCAICLSRAYLTPRGKTCQTETGSIPVVA